MNNEEFRARINTEVVNQICRASGTVPQCSRVYGPYGGYFKYRWSCCRSQGRSPSHHATVRIQQRRTNLDNEIRTLVVAVDNIQLTEQQTERRIVTPIQQTPTPTFVQRLAALSDLISEDIPPEGLIWENPVLRVAIIAPMNEITPTNWDSWNLRVSDFIMPFRDQLRGLIVASLCEEERGSLLGDLQLAIGFFINGELFHAYQSLETLQTILESLPRFLTPLIRTRLPEATRHPLPATLPHIRQIARNDLRYNPEDDEIGTGGAGTVYDAVLISDNIRCVVKKYKLPTAANWEEIKEQFLSEATILYNNQNTHVVKLFGIVIDETRPRNPYYALVLEKCEGGSLQNLLDRGTVSQHQHICQTIALQLAEMMSFLHFNHVLHHDIKPSNILFDIDPIENPDTFNLVVCDFHTSRQFDFTEDFTNTVSLSAWYEAPEILETGHGLPSDIWSFGSVLGHLFSGLRPHHTARVPDRHRGVAPTWNNLPEVVNRIIVQCHQQEPERRIKAFDILIALRPFVTRMRIIQSLSTWLNNRIEESYTLYRVNPNPRAQARTLDACLRVAHAAAQAETHLRRLSDDQLWTLYLAIHHREQGAATFLQIEHLYNRTLTQNNVIYFFRNRETRKIYVGKAFNFAERRRGHLSKGRSLVDPSKFDYQFAHDNDNWDWAILDTFTDSIQQNDLEVMYVMLLGSSVQHNPDFGLNVLLGGDLNATRMLRQTIL